MDTQPQRDDSHASALFRSFSFEVESRMPPNTATSIAEADDLAVAVVEKRKKDDLEAQERAEWRRYFDPWKPSDEIEIQKLDVQGNALSEAWTQFRTKLPEQEQIEFAKRPQTFDDVIQVIRKVEDEWQQKKKKGVFGHTKRYFRGVCTKIESHSTLLQLLPSSSQYASVLCGTLQTLIKASANYDNIAEGLSQSLFEITEAVETCVRECSLYPTKEIQYGVADLYAHIFLFLRDALGWYTKKSIRRLLSSFKEDFYQQFEDEVSNIQRISLKITRKAQHASQSELRYTRLLVEDLKKGQRLGLVREDREAADRQYQEQKAIDEREKELKRVRLLEEENLHRIENLLNIVGTSFKSICAEEVSKALGRRNQDSLGTRSVKEARSDLKGEPQLKTMSGSKEMQGREDIQLYSSGFEDYFDRSATMIEHDETSATFVEWPVVAALQEWTAALESQFLCVIGPDQMINPSSTALLAAKYAVSTAQCDLPVISFFCELPRKTRSRESTQEVDALMALIYALIRQLIDLLPSTFRAREHLDRQSIQALDGTTSTFAGAIALLKVLLDLSPSVLFCVIDGFELLDDQSTRPYLTDFVKALKGHRSGNEDMTASKRTLKFLFTTAGRSRCLLNYLQEEELAFAESSNAGRKPGKPMSGRRAMSPVNFHARN